MKRYLSEILVNGFKGLSVFESLFLAFTLLLAFFLPLYKAPISPIISMMMLLALIQVFSKNRKLLKPGPITLVLLILYILYIVGMFYTSDLKRGWFDLEVKLSFVILPLIFIFCGSLLQNPYRLSLLKIAFITGAIMNSFYCIAYAISRSMTYGFTFDYFEYTQLSNSFHPSYLAMYMNIALLLLSGSLLKAWNALRNSQRIGLMMLIAYLLVFIIFLNSKAGIILTSVTLLYFVFYIIIVKKKILYGLLALAGMIAIAGIVVTQVPYLTNRFVNMWEVIKGAKPAMNATDGNTDRMIIWKQSTGIIFEYMPFGAGTGDVQAELNRSYRLSQYSKGTDVNLNCHNQFLQTGVAIGFPGMLALITLLVLLLPYAIRKNNSYFFLIFIIFAGNFMVESMLETQAGVVFITFILLLADMVETRDPKGHYYLLTKPSAIS